MDGIDDDRQAAPHRLPRSRDLQVRFVSREATVHAVNGVSFTVNPGEVLCILGESGSGKSVTLRALMRLLPPRRTRIEGSVRVCGEDVLAMPGWQLRDFRGGLVSMIFQEPMTALDPVYTIGQQIGEVGAPPYRSRPRGGARPGPGTARPGAHPVRASAGSTPIRTNCRAASGSAR